MRSVMNMECRRCRHHRVLAGLIVASTVAPALAACDWVTVPGPYDAAALYFMSDIEALDLDSAWAVGHRAGTGAFLLSWDGVDWTGVPSPDVSALPGPFPPSGPNLQLTGVGPRASGEVWAVGSTSTPFPSLQIGWPVVARWTGSAWTDVAQIDLGTIGVPPNYARGGVIEGASVSPDGDVWAFGTANAGPGSPGIANILTIRYHDGRWSETPFPIGFTRVNIVGDVLALSATDAWLVGYGDSTGPFHPILAHWDGATWTSVPTPVSAQAQTMFASITGSGPDDLWISGQQPGGTLLMHYDGATWTVMPSPVNTTTRTQQIEMIAPDDVWAWSASAGAFHYDGVAWTPALIPAPAGTTQRGYAEFARIPGAAAMWACGSYTDAAGSRALLQRLDCATSGGPDLDGNGVVDAADLAQLLSLWGACPGCAADLDGDGAVGAGDLAMLLSAWS